MPTKPPPGLVELLARLGLATPAQLRRMAWRVRRVARELPALECVWIDALAQARVLTPFQAAELHAGRAETLRVGPYVLCERLAWPHGVAAYRARCVGAAGSVRLVVLEPGAERADELLRQLEALAAASRPLDVASLAPIVAAGRDGSRIWAAARWVDGRSVGQWQISHGRFPPAAALECARQVAAALAVVHEAGLGHGDLGTDAVIINAEGDVVLLSPGLAGIVRAGNGRMPEPADDIFACGCLWWQTLCGRAPAVHGDPRSVATTGVVRTEPPVALAESVMSTASTRSSIVDVRQLAPETPLRLATAIAECTQLPAAARPRAAAELVEQLGPPTFEGRIALEQALTRNARPAEQWIAAFLGIAPRGRSAWRRWSGRLGAVAATVMLLAVLAWSLHALRTGDRRQIALRPTTVPGDNAAQKVPTPELATSSSAADQPPQELRVDRPALPAAKTEQPTPTEPAAPHDVVPTSYQQVGPSRPPLSRPADLVLSGDEVHDAAALKFQPGQRVRGLPGRRPVLQLPPQGLPVAAEDVCFENLDFVAAAASGAAVATAAQPATAADSARAIPLAMIVLRCSRAEFCGCSFTGPKGRPALPAAIVCSDAASAAADTLPTGRLTFIDCRFAQVAAGVRWQRAGALALELQNVLYLGPGPLVQRDRAPQQDEPVRMMLSHLTLRASGPLLQCGSHDAEPPGSVAVEAVGCVFAPAAGEPLLRFSGASSPQPWLAALRWTGQDSLLAAETPFAVWQPPEGGRQTLDDTAADVAGLVRGTIGFAGGAESGSESSRTVRWQAPLSAGTIPGVDPKRLPVPSAKLPAGT